MSRVEEGRSLSRRSAFGRLTHVVFLAIALVAGASTWMAHVSLERASRDGAQRHAEALAAAVSGALGNDLRASQLSLARGVMQKVVDSDADVKLIAILDQHRAPILTYGDAHATHDLGAEAIVAIQPSIASEQAKPNGYVRVVLASADPGEAFTWFNCSVAMAALGALVLTTLMTSSLKRKARTALLLARDLGGHLYTRKNAPPLPDDLAEIEALLRYVMDDREAMRAQRTARAQEELRDVHLAISDVVKGDRDKQRLLEYADELVEKERERISLEIHDNLNATVVSIKLYAETIVASADASPPEDVRHCATQIVAIASEFYDNARAIVRELRPEVLDTLGLKCAIAELVRTLNEAKGSCRFECHGDDSLDEVPRPLSIAAYRVVQEALANVVKHARANLTSVSVTGAPPPHQIRIVVSDDGVGIDTARQQRSNPGTAGLGLIGMRERIHRLGGSFSVASGVQGTCITMVM